MRHKSAALAVVAALTLTGCSGTAKEAVSSPSPSESSPTVAPPSAEPIPSSTPTPKDTQKKSPRGNLLMEGGMFGTITDRSTGQLHTKIQVNAITPITCNQPYSRPSENGQIIVVDVVVETTPELAESSFPKFTLSSYDFKFIATNGTTFNGNLGTISTYSCIPDAEVFPSGGMGPAEKVTAKVVLDVPAPHGILIMKGGFGTGFEYTF